MEMETVSVIVNPLYRPDIEPGQFMILKVEVPKIEDPKKREVKIAHEILKQIRYTVE